MRAACHTDCLLPAAPGSARRKRPPGRRVLSLTPACPLQVPLRAQLQAWLQAGNPTLPWDVP